MLSITILLWPSAGPSATSCRKQVQQILEEPPDPHTLNYLVTSQNCQWQATNITECVRSNNRSYSETVMHLITYLTLSIKRLKIINDSITVELICGSSPRSPIQTPVLTIPIDTLSANATAIAVRHWPQFLRLLSTNVLPREYHCLLKHLIFCGHVPTSWRCLTDCLNLPSNSQK